MTDKRVVAVIVSSEEESYNLVRELNIEGYPDAFELEGDRMQALFEAMGYEGISAEEVDVAKYDKKLHGIEKFQEHGVREASTRMLAHIAWALTDIAKTHARSMPPVV
jgi:hypothetical protein